MTQLEELQAIEAVLNGDPDFFESLVIENQKLVYNLALRMTGSQSDALDLSQDVFFKAYTNLKNFRCDCRFSVWLYRMTYNMCIDFKRAAKRKPISQISFTNENGENAEFEIPDCRYNPEDELERKELREAVISAVNLLSDEHRQIIIMREFSGMSYGQIADALYLSEGTVKSRLARARQQLLKILVANGTFTSNIRHNERMEGGYGI